MNTEHPILFSGPMARAILEGRKTQTRRVVKFPAHAYQPNSEWVKSVHQDGGGNWIAWSTDEPGLAEFTKKAYPSGQGFMCPYGQPGHTLWVRERLVSAQDSEGSARFALYDVGRTPVRGIDGKPAVWCYKRNRLPAIFMPRWASRLTLRVKSVRVERLQSISEQDAIAEGVTLPPNTVTLYDGIYRAEFSKLWDSINAKRGHTWESNPWVWVIEFERV